VEFIIKLTQLTIKFSFCFEFFVFLWN